MNFQYPEEDFKPAYSGELSGQVSKQKQKSYDHKSYLSTPLINLVRQLAHKGVFQEAKL